MASREEIASILSIEKIAVADGTVSGEIHNRGPYTIREVQLFVRYTWLWDDQRNPGKIDPGTSTYHFDYGNPRRREPPLYLYTAASTTQGFRRTLRNLGNGRRILPSHSTDKVTPFTTTVTLVAKITVPRYVESKNDLGCVPEFPHGRELRLPECCVPVYAALWRAADHP